jgi:hypothetical protein
VPSFFASNDHLQSVEFATGEKVFVTTRSWGIAGNHNYIFFSSEQRLMPDESADMIFHAADIYFKKQEDDTLFLYAPSNTEKSKIVQINNIKVDINYFGADEWLELRSNYKDSGFSRIDASLGIVSEDFENAEREIFMAVNELLGGTVGIDYYIPKKVAGNRESVSTIKAFEKSIKDAANGIYIVADVGGPLVKVVDLGGKNKTIIGQNFLAQKKEYKMSQVINVYIIIKVVTKS